MAMPTQRPPFFASFFSAFRARTSPTFQAKSSVASPSLPSIAAHAHVSTTTANATSTTSRSITSSSTAESSSQSSHNTISAAGTTSKPTFSAAFTSTSPGTHSHSPFYSPRSPGSSSPTANPHGQTIPLTRGRQRRGSDSSNSSGGFMDALGNDKWYIGGRTAGGDERFYRLGLVTPGGARGSRATSLDRLSL